MWASFWCNAGAMQAKGAVSQKLILLQRATLPRLKYCCPRWAFSHQRARDVERIQHKMISYCINFPRNPSEGRRAYFNRRDAFCRETAVKCGLWSKVWANQILHWHDHIVRPRNGASWAAKVLKVQDRDWIRQQRLPWVCAARSLDAGGTGTRLLAERPKARWDEATHAALAYLQS